MVQACSGLEPGDEEGVFLIDQVKGLGAEVAEIEHDQITGADPAGDFGSIASVCPITRGDLCEVEVAVFVFEPKLHLAVSGGRSTT